MDCNTLKQRLESISCHIHGDAAYVTVQKNNTLEIETCCLLFRHQILLMAGKDERVLSELETKA